MDSLRRGNLRRCGVWNFRLTLAGHRCPRCDLWLPGIRSRTLESAVSGTHDQSTAAKGHFCLHGVSYQPVQIVDQGAGGNGQPALDIPDHPSFDRSLRGRRAVVAGEVADIIAKLSGQVRDNAAFDRPFSVATPSSRRRP